MTYQTQETTLDRILQEISAVGRRLEGMDSMMASLTEETKLMLLDIAVFQSRMTSLEQRVTTVEAQASSSLDRDQELLYLCSKLIDLEDRSRRDNNEGGAKKLVRAGEWESAASSLQEAEV
ncbi:hypothetical protein NDU88_002274 [Pleurodeles waltl]|uniref:Uncharacterized protein n=1 Tax=Pleurodeles waltl TaxID=8319 RepID=A0AAV7WNZ6_PLEWA|nr:hypothetical protein NDU88_002274 [Pleurodeles waltl]